MSLIELKDLKNTKKRKINSINDKKSNIIKKKSEKNAKRVKTVKTVKTAKTAKTVKSVNKMHKEQKLITNNQNMDDQLMNMINIPMTQNEKLLNVGMSSLIKSHSIISNMSNMTNNIVNIDINFNDVLSKSFEKNNFKLIKNSSNNKQNYNKYESSFDDIISFRKRFSNKEINDIDAIVYHDENSDGMFSAAIAYHYLTENNKNKEILLIGEKPGKTSFIEKIRDKNLLIVDLSLDDFKLNLVNKNAKSYIVIDDHNQRASDRKNVFNGNYHSACGYTWKFFYPKLAIPKTILYIDSSDGKLFLSFIPKSYSTLIAQSIGIRYSHSKSKKTMMNKQSGKFFIQLWNILNNENSLKLLITIGHYYHEFSENLKEQIAINAVPMKFQGYNVGVLNFNSPLLSKPVARQIITNFKNKGLAIDFAILWGYEYTSNAYRIQLMDDHKQTKIRMDEIAGKLGSIGGSSKMGFGHAHVGNFYWQRKPNQDIWDLFTKQYL